MSSTPKPIAPCRPQGCASTCSCYTTLEQWEVVANAEALVSWQRQQEIEAQRRRQAEEEAWENEQMRLYYS